jgi:hypothetical protein
VHARDVDDAAEAACVHAGQRGTDEQERRLEHEPQDEREPVGLELLDRPHVLDAGIVHEDVGFEGEPGERRRIGQVDLPGFATQLVRDSRSRLAVQVGNDDMRARGREGARTGFADAARTPGDDGASPGQIGHDSSFVPASGRGPFASSGRPRAPPMKRIISSSTCSGT